MKIYQGVKVEVSSKNTQFKYILWTIMSCDWCRHAASCEIWSLCLAVYHRCLWLWPSLLILMKSHFQTSQPSTTLPAHRCRCKWLYVGYILWKGILVLDQLIKINVTFCFSFYVLTTVNGFVTCRPRSQIIENTVTYQEHSRQTSWQSVILHLHVTCVRYRPTLSTVAILKTEVHTKHTTTSVSFPIQKCMPNKNRLTRLAVTTVHTDEVHNCRFETALLGRFTVFLCSTFRCPSFKERVFEREALTCQTNIVKIL